MSSTILSTIIIIPAASQDAANTASVGAETFTVPLSGVGGSTPTHYWCAGRLSAEQIEAFQAAVPDAEVHEWDVYDNPSFPDQLLQQNGLERFGLADN